MAHTLHAPKEHDLHTPFITRVLSLALILSFSAGCTSSRGPAQEPAAAAHGLVVPATYTGTLPCADCPGIQLTLTLLPDSTFRLRRVYQDRPAVFHGTGRWSTEENGTRLVLRADNEPPRFFRIAGADSLRMLDTHGQPIQSPFNDWLVRAPQVDPVRDSAR